MKSFRKLAVITTAATYVLIYMGGLVRAAGAGLGCPDWPRCFDRWIPPLHVSQLPADIPPEQFNFVLAWIEYVNRLTGVTVGLLILALAIAAVRVHRRTPRIWMPALGVLLLVAYQGWQGGQVVASALHPLMITIHLVTAVVIAGLLVYITQTAWYMEHPEFDTAGVMPAGTGLHLWALAGLTVVQLALGTQVRGMLEMQMDQYPLESAAALLSRIGAVENIHMVAGIALLLMTMHTGLNIFRFGTNASTLVRQCALAVMLLVALQAAIGIGMAAFGLPQLLRLLHMLLSTVYCGLLVVLFTAWNKQKPLRHA